MNNLWVNIGLFLLGFACLTGGADLLVRGAGRLAVRLNLSATVIGLTIVAFGTSLPELLVSLVANLQGNGAGDIAIGNVVGSNIANMGLILGTATLLAAIPVELHLLRREYPLMLLVSVLFTAMAWSGTITRWEALLLLVGLIGFAYYSYSVERMTPDETIVSGEEAFEVLEALDPGIGEPSSSPILDTVLVVLGISSLLLGASWLVSSAQFLARAIGISELVIGLTLVAVGTSLPELATSVVAVLRGQGDIAVGNVVGSNLFNMLAIVGITALVRPLTVPSHMISVDFPVMLALAGGPFLLLLPAPHRLTRWMGALLLVAYLLYITWLFLSGQ